MESPTTKANGKRITGFPYESEVSGINSKTIIIKK